MKQTLLEELNSDGYVVIENFLSPTEVDELYEAGQALISEAPEEGRKVFSAANTTESHQNKEEYFLESGDKVRFFFESGALDENGKLLVDPTVALNKVGHALHVENEIFKKITFCDRVKEVCWQLGYNKPAIPQSMYIYKNPGIGSEVKSHQDGTYLFTEPNSVVGFWIALEDATLQNGCLQFISGSHKSGVHRRYIRNLEANSNELLIYDKPAPTYPISNFTSVPIKKGSCILIHSQIVHRSDPNRSKKSRHAYTFHVIETKNTKYSEQNWLQLPKDSSFPVLYEKLDE